MDDQYLFEVQVINLSLEMNPLEYFSQVGVAAVMELVLHLE